MKDHTIKKQNTVYGFSLLETLVAISILMMTIVGPLELASKGIVFADYVKDEITGFYLAQEAIEAIRNIRDTNIKNSSSWLSGIREKCINSAGVASVPCRIDIWDFSPNKGYGLEKCPGACLLDDQKKWEKMEVVDVGDSRGTVKLYGYNFTDDIKSSATPGDSMFSRRITITPISYMGKGLTAEQVAETQFDPSGIDEVNVTVEVYWSRSSLQGIYAERNVTVSENMFSI
ncbi:MAG: hypothetical protein HY226_00105 [Candidatus Vogelbacteria bacterium]|nr:hypothetical protein [Candidatus Vogelbacteria bacterium]